MSLLTLALDFDGCVHSYTSGWKGAAVIPDPPVPGAIAFLTEAVQRFRVCICSSRCVGEEIRSFINGQTVVSAKPNWHGIYAMDDWFEENGLPRDVRKQLEYWVAKPPAHIMIDDRALRFDGDWSAVLQGDLLKFKPWNHSERHP